MDYKNKAINCVKDTVLLEQKRQFEECGCNLDEQYKKYGNTEAFFADPCDPAVGNLHRHESVNIFTFPGDEPVEGGRRTVFPENTVAAIRHDTAGG